MRDMLIEPAPAKVNLTLVVHGRRPDGYHELESLVVFTSIADALAMLPGDVFDLEVDGPFAAAIEGDNLVARAHTAVQLRHRTIRTGRVRLAKQLPIAAGIGGGSADAGAMLRLLARLNPPPSGPTSPVLMQIARTLGADVPVCLAAVPAFMRGIGDVVEPVSGLPELSIVLANPGVPLVTAPVFARLAAPALSADHGNQSRDSWSARAATTDLVALIERRGNGLAAAARALCPAIDTVLSALRAQHGTLVAAMSGSGPTCFALFAESHRAEAAARALRRSEPGWWVEAGQILSQAPSTHSSSRPRA